MREEQPARPALPLIELDAGIEIAISVLIFWCIVVATGATLGVNHRDVQTAQDAAAALAPLAGPLAGLLFAVGLLGSALIALPVLAATNAYCVTAACHWPGGIDQRPQRETGRFYAVVLGSLVVGAGLTLLGIDPIRLLFLAGLVGGLGTPVLLAFLLWLATSERVMGDQAIGGALAWVGWATTGNRGPGQSHVSCAAAPGRRGQSLERGGE